MASAHYFVVCNERQWTIRHNGQHYRYLTQEDAITAAIYAAHSSGQNGHDAQVLVQGLDNQVRPEWTYGVDAYPPARGFAQRLAALSSFQAKYCRSIQAEKSRSSGSPKLHL
jgi:hypothetical protein